MQPIGNHGASEARRLFGLEGKTVLVTGASKGIGQSVAQSCAAAGARMVITGRDPARLEATLKSLAGDGHRALTVDLTDMAAVRQLASDCGTVDGVVHSAGVQGVAPMKMLSDAFLRSVFDTNYIAPIMLTRQLLNRAAIRSGGSILFLSSIAAVTGTVGLGPYAGSKAALLGTMRPLSLELAKRRIRANALAPAIVETPLTTSDIENFEANRKRYPLDVGQPDDIAWASLFFLSDASSKVTGTVFNLDGGIPYV